jgi:hypothetical protein
MKTLKKTGTVKSFSISAHVGARVVLDGLHSVTRTLRSCDWWDGADYAWDIRNGGPIDEVAVNVYVTGRTLQWHFDEQVIRCKVEFVGDGEPSEFADGWLFLNGSKQEDN